MAAGDIGEVLHRPIQVFLRAKIVQVGAFILQCVEVALHRRVVVGISGPAHALGDLGAFTEFRESPGCILAALIAVEDDAALCQMLRIQSFLQGADGQVAGDVPVCYAGDHASVIEVHDGTVVTRFPILPEQVREICTPFLVGSVRPKILFQVVFKHFVGLSGLCSRLFRANDGAQPQFLVHVFVDGSVAIAVSLALQINLQGIMLFST